MGTSQKEWKNLSSKLTYVLITKTGRKNKDKLPEKS